MSLFTETVEIGTTSVTGVDAYGNDVTEFAWVDSPAWLEQLGATEDDDRAELTVVSMRLFVPLSTVIKTTSRVRWSGHEYDVDGLPGHQPGGFIVEGFRVCVITREEG